jgi:quinol monooxygenase YgiN
VKSRHNPLTLPKLKKMFIRIVKLSFHEENIPALENFETIKERICSAPGNRLLELYQDKTIKHFFYLHWGN